MRELLIYIEDVFAEEKYAGNQLAIVRDAEALSTLEVQTIAKEMHFSETSFTIPEKTRQGGYNVHIFTREEELRFAGHPNLGTAYMPVAKGELF